MNPLSRGKILFLESQRWGVGEQEAVEAKETNRNALALLPARGAWAEEPVLGEVKS